MERQGIKINPKGLLDKTFGVSKVTKPKLTKQAATGRYLQGGQKVRR